MRAKLESLPMTELRELAKFNNVKGVTTLRKKVLIDKILEAVAQKGESDGTPAEDKKPVKVTKSSNEAKIKKKIVEQDELKPSEAKIFKEVEFDETKPVKEAIAEVITNVITNAANGAYDVSFVGEFDDLEEIPTPLAKPTRKERMEKSFTHTSEKKITNNIDTKPMAEKKRESKFDFSLEPRTEYKLDFRNEAKPATESRTEYMSETKTETKTETKIETKPEIKIDDSTESKAEIKTEAKYATVAEASKYYGITPDKSPQPFITISQRQEMIRKQALEEQVDLSLDSGVVANGILEIMQDGFGFIRGANYMPSDNDVYVSPAQIKKFGLKKGDIIVGKVRIKTQNEKFGALLYINTINGYTLQDAMKRKNFESLTPIFPNQRLKLETDRSNMAMRIVDLISPIGKGQRGMIVSPPKAGKTTLLKESAKAIQKNNPEMHLIILLIDERPEEVTDIKEAIYGSNVEVIYSTFDELPDHHRRVAEMVMERAKRLVEHGRDVTILLDSVTRLARAYNILIPASGRTLSGGLDPAALHMPKKFFGAARNMREGGSLTILATALVETGSKMDDVIFEEFKGTGNMELVLDRKLSEKRVFPAIDIVKSGTRRDDLLLNDEEIEALDRIHKATNTLKPDETVERILDLFAKTKDNAEFCQMIKKIRL